MHSCSCSSGNRPRFREGRRIRGNDESRRPVWLPSFPRKRESTDLILVESGRVIIDGDNLETTSYGDRQLRGRVRLRPRAPELRPDPILLLVVPSFRRAVLEPDGCCNVVGRDVAGHRDPRDRSRVRGHQRDGFAGSCGRGIHGFTSLHRNTRGSPAQPGCGSADNDGSWQRQRARWLPLPGTRAP